MHKCHKVTSPNRGPIILLDVSYCSGELRYVALLWAVRLFVSFSHDKGMCLKQILILATLVDSEYI